MSLQFLERKATSRARHHECSSLRITLLGDLLLWLLFAVGEGSQPLASTSWHLTRGGVAGTRVRLWGWRWCGAGPLAVRTATSVVSGSRMGRQRSVSAPSLPGAWLKRQRHLLQPPQEGNRKSRSVCRSHRGAVDPHVAGVARSQALPCPVGVARHRLQSAVTPCGGRRGRADCSLRYSLLFGRVACGGGMCVSASV